MKGTDTLRTRIAPTPSGFLHAGNAVNFLLTQAIAQREHGTLFLRIDDLDAERMRPAFVEDIFDSLAWLGIAWQEGPRSLGELVSGWSQHLRIGRYNALMTALADAHVLYACTCSRKQAPDCPHRTAGLPLDVPDATWRLRIPEGCTVEILNWPGGSQRVRLDELMPDPVIRQRNGMPSYQVASLADDLDHGINMVVRGLDLLPSSACQLFMAQAIGAEAFGRVRFVHHALLVDERGEKLAKSAGAASLRAIRERGEGPGILLERARRMLDELLR